jgi:putative hydrolase of the HAD superfamily
MSELSATPPPPAGPDLSHVDTWLFDLDNTLYPHRCNLFVEMDRRMGQFIANLLGVGPEEARRVQKDFYFKHGTTLRGLMLEHGVPPEEYLHFVHDLDVSVVPPAPDLDAALAALPGRKIVFTNGSVPHATRVLNRLGVAHRFEAIFDIAAAAYIPKPDPKPYDVIVRQFGIAPRRTAMVEDVARNLIPAHALGMTTVWVPGGPERAAPAPADAPYVHHRTGEDLAAWLNGLTRPA